jgi:tryptophan synthase alpha chain
MNRIDGMFAKRREERRKVLIGYVTAGFPDQSALRILVSVLEKAGVDIIEIGIPFSDPIADGPTIQQASVAALKQGVTLDWVLSEVVALRRSTATPLIFMSYSNPIYKKGIAKFFHEASEAGLDGVIIPDLIPEEGAPFQKAAEAHGVDLIYLVAPTSPLERIRRIAAETRGFLYAVSLAGVTGARVELAKGLSSFLKQVKRLSPAPVAVGFGISTPEHARALAPLADGLIVGSALIKEIEHGQSDGYQSASAFMRSLRQALDESVNNEKESPYAARE